MEKKYTLELTYEELRLIDRALIHEGDKREAMGDSTYKDVDDVEDIVHRVYMKAKIESAGTEREWIVAERDRV